MYLKDQFVQHRAELVTIKLYSEMANFGKGLIHLFPCEKPREIYTLYLNPCLTVIYRLVVGSILTVAQPCPPHHVCYGNARSMVNVFFLTQSKMIFILLLLYSASHSPLGLIHREQLNKISVSCPRTLWHMDRKRRTYSHHLEDGHSTSWVTSASITVQHISHM